MAYQNNLGNPGDPPSPNQKLVLDSLAILCEMMDRQTPGTPGITIHHLTNILDTQRVGGSTTIRRGWEPWAESTVRDHLAALVHRGHVKKRRVGKPNYYRPV